MCDDNNDDDDDEWKHFQAEREITRRLSNIFDRAHAGEDLTIGDVNFALEQTEAVHELFEAGGDGQCTLHHLERAHCCSG